MNNFGDETYDELGLVADLNMQFKREYFEPEQNMAAVTGYNNVDTVFDDSSSGSGDAAYCKKKTKVIVGVAVVAIVWLYLSRK